MQLAFYDLELEASEEANELLSISEFSKMVNMSVSRLRYYANMEILVPASRIIDPESKRIGYSPMQITTVNLVRVLSDIGVKIETIKDLAKTRTPGTMLKVMFAQENEAARKARIMQEATTIIKTHAELINEGIRAIEADFSVVEMPEKSIVLGNKNNFFNSAGFYEEFVRFCRDQSERHINLSYPIGGYFDNMEMFLENPSHPQRFFSLNPHGGDSKPAGLYLTGYTRGYYGETDDLPKRMNLYARDNGLDFNGPVYNIYPFAELCITDPNQYLLQASVSVVETNTNLPKKTNTTKNN